MIKTSAEIRKWPPHKSCVSWLIEMSLVGCRNKLPVSWDTAIWCGTRNLGNFIFSLVRSLSFAVVRLPNWPYKKGTGLSPWFIEEQTEAQSEMQLDLSSTGTTGGVRIWTQAVLPMTLNGLFHSNLQLHQIPQLVGTSESGKEQGHSCLVILRFLPFIYSVVPTFLPRRTFSASLTDGSFTKETMWIHTWHHMWPLPWLSPGCSLFTFLWEIT